MNPTLANKLYVPSCLVPLGAIQEYQATLKDVDGKDVPLSFWEYNPTTDLYSFARGHAALNKRHFHHISFEDVRSSPRLSCLSIDTSAGRGLKFVGQLRKHQQDVVDAVLKTDCNGIIDAPPRFGKTITMVYLECEFKVKALFLSPNIDLGRQMLQAFRNFTNIFELEYITGRKLIDLVDDWDDLKDLDIAIMNYHPFTSGFSGSDMMERYANEFGAVFIDEVHTATSPSFSKVVTNFNSKIRLGVTGTVERKDKMNIVNEFTVGPVLAVGEAPQLPCQVRAVKTGSTIPIPMTKWNKKQWWSQVHTHLAKDEKRNLLLLNYLKTYADAGHFCIAVADRTSQIDYLVRVLKDWGVDAEAYHRDVFGSNKKKREQCLDRCREGKTKVLIAYRRMVLGIDLPRFTAFFCLSPTANKPAYYQEFSRVRTPFENKVMGYIVDFVDNHPVLENCYLARKNVYDKHGFQEVHEFGGFQT